MPSAVAVSDDEQSDSDSLVDDNDDLLWFPRHEHPDLPVDVEEEKELADEF